MQTTDIRNKPNYFYAIISVALVLFLLGFFGMILLYAQRVVSLFKERVNILVELTADAGEEGRSTLETWLNDQSFVKKGSLAFTSKEEAARQMREDFGEDFIRLDLPNPFYDMLSFNVRASHMHTDSLSAIRTQIKSLSGVGEVYYQENIISKVGDNIKKIGYLTLGTALFFIFVAITLIHYTIRLALYANRFLIKNMELVGASWGFISRPYVVRAVQHGAFSGLLAAGALAGLVAWLHHSLPDLKDLQMTNGLVLVFLILIILGVLINTWSTYWVVKKYLRMRVDDLY